MSPQCNHNAPYLSHLLEIFGRINVKVHRTTTGRFEKRHNQLPSRKEAIPAIKGRSL